VGCKKGLNYLLGWHPRLAWTQWPAWTHPPGHTKWAHDTFREEWWFRKGALLLEFMFADQRWAATFQAHMAMYTKFLFIQCITLILNTITRCLLEIQTLFPLTVLTKSEIYNPRNALAPTSLPNWKYNNYLCTCVLYRPVCKVFDAGKSITRGGPWTLLRDFFGQRQRPTPSSGLARIKHFTHGAV
jgi:hypothetical protein